MFAILTVQIRLEKHVCRRRSEIRTGGIPAGFGELVALTGLDLSGNMLDGRFESLAVYVCNT